MYDIHASTISINDLADWTLLPNDNKIIFEGGEIGYREIIGHPLLSYNFLLLKLVDEEKGIAIVLDYYGNTIYKLIGKTGDILEAASLKRNSSDDRGLMTSKFLKVPTRTLFIYESGIIGFDEYYNLIWQHTHDFLGCFFSHIDEYHVIYTSEHKGKWTYRIADGLEEKE